jgi:hypothetical protein
MLASACRGATRDASSPHGTTRTTAASVAPGARIDRILVAEGGEVALATRGGCLASMRTVEGGAGSNDELRIRCPKPERIGSFFDTVDREIARIQLAPIQRHSAESDKDDSDKSNKSESDKSDKSDKSASHRAVRRCAS